MVSVGAIKMLFPDHSANNTDTRRSGLILFMTQEIWRRHRTPVFSFMARCRRSIHVESSIRRADPICPPTGQQPYVHDDHQGIKKGGNVPACNTAKNEESRKLLAKLNAPAVARRQLHDHHRRCRYCAQKIGSARINMILPGLLQTGHTPYLPGPGYCKRFKPSSHQSEAEYFQNIARYEQ